MTKLKHIFLDDDLVAFLESGVPVQVGTRDVDNKTTYSRSWGCMVNDDRLSVTLFLYRSYCTQALQNIRENGVFAAVFINVLNYETYQLKGSHAKILDDLTPYRQLLSEYNESQAELIKAIGLPQIAVANMAGQSIEDYVAVYCPVTDCFKQTPGPGAGDRREVK